MFKFSLFLFTFSLFSISDAYAAPCCASSGAAPSIISGDDQTQFTLTTARSSVIGDAPDQGRAVFRSSDDSESSLTHRIDMAQVFFDRYQAGLSIPVVSREVNRPSTQAQATRLGDVRVTAAYEALPEWTYSPWKPKGHVFLQGSLPTGRSLYDSQEIGAVDATGRGFYALAGGVLLSKTKGAWDGFFIPEIHYGFPRSFDGLNGNESIRVHPRFGMSFALGVGYSPRMGNLRVGVRLQPVFNQSKIVKTSSNSSETGTQSSWDSSLELSYLLNDHWSLLSSYTDQTLLGPAKNSTLSRTFAFGIQHRLAR